MGQLSARQRELIEKFVVKANSERQGKFLDMIMQLLCFVDYYECTRLGLWDVVQDLAEAHTDGDITELRKISSTLATINNRIITRIEDLVAEREARRKLKAQEKHEASSKPAAGVQSAEA